jgi:lipid A 4'-phosphatase
MNRTGLVIALGIAAAAGLLFGLYPDLDLAISRPFYDVAAKDFTLRFNRVLLTLRYESMWIVTALVAPAAIAFIVKLLLPWTRMLMSARAVTFLLWTLILGPGLIVNVTLKDYWPRSRPIDVPEFSGTEWFSAWWDPRGGCPKNCSFVAGESSGAFWTMAPAALAPPQWRALAYGAAVAFGAGIGTLRIAFGGHFFSDALFSGVVVFLIIWTVHGFLYRWRATRVTDEMVEGAIARITLPLYRALGRLIGRAPSGPA